MANEKTKNETLKITPTTSNCNCKNSVFCDLFYADENADKNLLELINALLDTNYESADCLEKMRIEEYYDHPYKDDVVVLVDGKNLLIIERRTDDNPNVPLNLFSYYMQIVESLARENSHHRGTVGKLPAPIFVVLYNGEIDIPVQSEMTLSDAFMSASIVPSMNVSVQQININYDKGHELLRKCQTLQEYSMFVKEVRKHNTDGNGLRKAICNCINNNVLKEYLIRKENEVINMMMDEYNYETDICVNREEAFRAGVRAKAKEDSIALHNLGYFVDKICEFHNNAYSKEQILQWIDEYEDSLAKA